ncbi:hypothetical protein OAP18_00825 [Gammaproteobacteria bacterium]|nr:hypothetical protein [Gammaproteobacteria bacterium]
MMTKTTLSISIFGLLAVLTGCSNDEAVSVTAEQQTVTPPSANSSTIRGDDFTGVWGPVFTEDFAHRLVGPMRGDYTGLPLNDAAKEFADNFDEASQYDYENQCKSHTTLYAFRSPFQFEIMQSNNLLSITTESFEQVRTVYLDGREHHPPTADHSRMGHSIGHWQGNMLVVSTINMEAGYLRRNFAPHSENAHLTEYIVRHTGPAPYEEFLTITSVLDDPEYLTEPLVRNLSYRKIPDGTLEPYPCERIDFDAF